MTVATELASVTRNWTGVESTFPTGMPARDASHVVITAQDAAGTVVNLVRNVHYTSALDAGTRHLIITPVALPAAPQTLVISRRTPSIQESDFIATSTFDAEIVEGLFDAGAMRDAERQAQINDILDRALLEVPPGSNVYEGMGRIIRNLAPGTQSNDAATVQQIQGIVAAAGNVPLPLAGQRGSTLMATGAGTFGWLKSNRSIEAYGAVPGNAALCSAALVAAVQDGGAYIPAGNYVFDLNAVQSAIVLPKLSTVVAEAGARIRVDTDIQNLTTAGPMIEIGAENHNIELVGRDPIALTMTGQPTVSGSQGAWSVTYPVANTIGVLPGMGLKNYEVGPLPVHSGDRAFDYVFRGLIPGELGAPTGYLGLFNNTPGTNAFSFFNASLIGSPEDIAIHVARIASYVTVGSLITWNGQTREVATVSGTGGTFTAVSAAVYGAVNERVFYVSRKSTGTCTMSGNTATIAGGAANSEADIGSLLLCEGVVSEVTAVNSNTSVSIHRARTVASARPFSFIVPPGLHSGLFKITAVTSTSVTVLNRGRVRPPRNLINTGSLRVLRTTLQQDTEAAGGTGGGISMLQAGAIKYINNLAIFGNRVTAAIGVALSGRVEAMPPSLTLSYGSFTHQSYSTFLFTGPDFGVADWFYNIVLGHGCIANLRMGAASSAVLISVWLLENSFANLRRFSIGACASPAGALSINSGAGALLTESEIFSNFGDGMRAGTGSFVYCESPFSGYNGVHNNRLQPYSTTQWSAGISVCAGAVAFYIESGLGEIKDFPIWCNRNNGADFQFASGFNLTKCFLSGNFNNINAINSYATINGTISTGASNIGIYASGPGQIVGSGILTEQNGASGTANIRFDNGARGSFPGGSRIPDAQVTGADSYIDLTGWIGGAPTLVGVGRFNEFTANRSIIVDSLATGGVGFAGIRINGGSAITFAQALTTVFDPPSIAAGAQATFDVTMNGVASIGFTALMNSNGTPAGVSYSVLVPAANTLRGVIANNSAAAIDQGNSTFTFHAFGMT
jgi:hypothetical protein